MIKDSKYIIKRVIIGVCIALIIMIIKGNLITSVYAAENKNNIYYYVPDDEEMQNFNNVIWTNFATDTLDPTLPFTMGAEYFYQYRFKDEPARIYTTGTIGGYSDFIGESYNVLPGYSGHYDNSYTSIDKLTYYVSSMGYTGYDSYSTHLPIIKNTSYEVLIELEKTNNLTWYANSDNMFKDSSLYNLRIVDSSGNSLPQSSIDYKNVEWIPPIKVPGGGGNPNLAYIKIRFELSDIVNTKNYYLDKITLTSSLPIGYGSLCYNNSDSSCGLVSFVFNGSDSTGTLRTKSFSIVENGYISLSSSESDIPGAMPGMDSITQNDLMIQNKYQDCSSTDIVCHLENLQQGIFDVFVRIGNFFTNLVANIREFFNSLFEFIRNIFFPTDEQLITLQDFFSDTISMLTTKLGFISYPFQVISDIFNVYIDVLTHTTNNYVITLPTLKEPFSNAVIYNGGTLDLGYIINYGKIKDLYDLYYSFISVYIILLFLDLCYDAYASFINGNLHSASTYTHQDLEMFDSNTGEVYTSTRVVKSTRKTIGR